MLTKEQLTARAWAEIDLDHILSNYQNALLEIAPGVRHFTVLKANAYGMGAAPIARALYGAGARLFAVACAMEAVELARALPGDVEVLIMGEIFPEEMDLVLPYPILPTLNSLERAERFSQKAVAAGKTVSFHCKLDTGLHRLGLTKEEAVAQIPEMAKLPGLRLQGLFSHLQRRSREHDLLQAQRLLSARDALADAGVSIPTLHLLDSIGMWRYPQHQLDAVRDAAYVLGHTPKDYPRPERLRFPLTLKARVARVHWAEAGDCLGYDAEHPLTKRTRVATLSVGYADGYPRAMSQVGQVVLHGKRAKVLGVVCMDLMMVDITGIEAVQAGDVATLLGGGDIGIHEYAGFSGGYNNEYLCMIGRRVPRLYLQNGQVVDTAVYLNIE